MLCSCFLNGPECNLDRLTLRDAINAKIRVVCPVLPRCSGLPPKACYKACSRAPFFARLFYNQSPLEDFQPGTHLTLYCTSLNCFLPAVVPWTVLPFHPFIQHLDIQQPCPTSPFLSSPIRGRARRPLNGYVSVSPSFSFRFNRYLEC